MDWFITNTFVHIIVSNSEVPINLANSVHSSSWHGTLRISELRDLPNLLFFCQNELILSLIVRNLKPVIYLNQTISVHEEPAIRARSMRAGSATQCLGQEFPRHVAGYNDQERRRKAYRWTITLVFKQGSGIANRVKTLSQGGGDDHERRAD